MSHHQNCIQHPASVQRSAELKAALQLGFAWTSQRTTPTDVATGTAVDLVEMDQARGSSNIERALIQILM